MKRVLIGALAVGAIGVTTLAAESASAWWYGPATFQPIGTWTSYSRGIETISYAVGAPYAPANAAVSANNTVNTRNRAQARCRANGITTTVDGPAVNGVNVGEHSYAFCTQQLLSGRGQIDQ